LRPDEVLDNFGDILRYLNRHADRFYTAHPALLRAVIHSNRPERPNPKLYAQIRRIFEQPYAYATLTTLSSINLLGYAIPPLKKVIDLPQFDGYHTYTVDIHSLQALRYLEEPKNDPLLDELYQGLRAEHRCLLKIVTLLHDAGKGRKKDHHQVGVSLFRVFAEKLGLTHANITMGEQLILYHTLMSTTA
jgi:[protein-PII] uridylyltransferase